MKKRVSLSIILFLFFSGGCQNTDALVDVITFQPSDYEVMFFKTESDTDWENIYMDAILDLKAKYPGEFNEVQTFEENIEEFNESITEEGPTLIIKKDGQTKTNLSGEVPKEKIKKELEMTMK